MNTLETLTNRIQILEAAVASLTQEAQRWAGIASRIPDPGLAGGRARPRSHVVQKAALIVQHVAKGYGCDPADILGLRKVRPIDEARAVTIYLVRLITGATFHEAGAAVNRTHSNAVKMSAKIAGMIRDRPAFEKWVKELEKDAWAAIERSGRASKAT